ncbi:MAG TPA: hypothetical protein VGK67_21590 [Myxococcales bacterium]|jgi:spermidine synthase
MKPWKTLGTDRLPDGQELALQERDGVFVIRLDGRELMSSARHGSEEALARAGLADLRREAATVLVGGLGLGYTLRAALDLLPAKASVVVAEISKAVVEWNRGPLAALAGAPLDDPRVKIEVAEIGKYLAKTRERFDAILTDVDNGPSADPNPTNDRLYTKAGLAAFRDALRPGGMLVIWSAGPAEGFVKRLSQAGFRGDERRVDARAGKEVKKGTQHMLFIGRRPF